MTPTTTATSGTPALPRPLPRRPRLLPGLPVLWRGDGTVQIGLDPRYAVVVDRLSPDMVRVLRELDGRHTLDRLLDLGAQDGSAETRSELAGLLSALDGAGVLDRDSTGSPCAPQREPPPGLIADAGIWALRTGRACADILAERGRTTVHVHGSGRVADALAAILRSAGLGTVRRIAKRSRSIPDFAVLIGSVVQDHPLRTTLMADGVPHLAVELHEVSAHIGPFVVPGRTSCLTCVDLRRSERDPAWGVVSSQLGTLSPPDELICAHGAAVVAAGQLLLMLSHSGGAAGLPPTWNGSLELDPVRGKVFQRALPPRQGCACGGAEGGSAYM
ncbi:hypothetical protein NLX83_04535 [Allokutzneria sp. A3M-2-11 16]|uniref:hypothetical protein n=1 Tax=Allokutzneria sp. A3M-2-11 16 TaxID=2962043 RepID=UPI0020B73F0E|nr:hypothetical protein [Allokutzneria sp. A3M-2-11 16]MCP3798519.1 hypothetical protein [Allokutzneria sp. A3M-2-11 16]